MKKFLAIVAACLLTFTANAQQQAEGSLSIRPELGLNASSMEGDNASVAKYRIGFPVVGAEMQYQAKDWLGISFGLLYAQQGYKVEGGKASLGPLTVTADDKEWKPGYLNVPVLANFYVAPGLALKTGLQPGFLLSKDGSDNANTFNLSLPVGISYEISNVVLDARYNLGLTDTFKDDNNHWKNSVFQFTVGYRFDL